MPYKGNRRKKRYTHERLPQGVEPEIDRTIPRSVIVHTDATLDASMSRLIMDWRKCFLPHTMIKLALRSRNKLKDYAALHTSLGVSHLHMFSSPDFGATLRLTRLPAGPTVLFRVESYTTMRDIVALLRRPFSGGTNQYMVPPMVVLSGFSTSKVKNEPHIALLRELLPSLVPTVAVDQSLKMSKLQRVLFFHYLTDEEGEGLIEVRHYYITARPVGLNRAIQKLKDGKIPRTVGTSDSFSEVLTHEGLLSDTDGEGEEVRLPEDVEFRREKGSCRVKLVELGPRMTWRPLRVEAGLCGGEVLWHQYITKTPEEVHQLHERKRKMERLKRLRVKEQEENVNRKKQSENPIQGPETDNSQQTVEFPDMDGTTDHEGIKKARKEPSGVKKRVSFST